MNQITDHATAAVARLLQQFRGLSRIEKLVRALASRTQGIEDMLWSLATERGIDNAIGAQLDVIGRRVGQSREGMDDEVYRVWLRARMLLNRCSGTAPEIVAIFKLLLPVIGGSGLEIELQPPAALVLRILGKLTGDADQLARILRKAKVAGVRALLEWRLSTEDETFQCQGDALEKLTAITDSVLVGDTAIQVDSTAKLEPSGYLTIASGTDDEETVAYTVTDETHIAVAAGAAFAHAMDTEVAVAAMNGFGDELDEKLGGQMADAQ